MAMSESPTIPRLPDALIPPTEPGNSNEPIPLYSGQAQLSQGDKAFSANTLIRLEWLPSPSVRFATAEVPMASTNDYSSMGSASLRLDAGTFVTKGQVTGMSPTYGPHGLRSYPGTFPLFSSIFLV